MSGVSIDSDPSLLSFEMDNSQPLPTSSAPSTPSYSQRRKRNFTEGQQARVKCDNCRDAHILCSPPRTSPTPLGCDTCKRSKRHCGGYTVKVRREKRQKEPEQAPRATPSQSRLPPAPGTLNRSTTTAQNALEAALPEVIESQGDYGAGDGESLPNTPTRTLWPSQSQDWDFQDLVDAAIMFQLNKIGRVIRMRQQQRVLDLFGTTHQPRVEDGGLYRSLNEFASQLRNRAQRRMARVTARSAEEILLRQILAALGPPTCKCDIAVEMMRGEVFGSELLKFASSISQSSRGLSGENIRKLDVLWDKLGETAPRIKEVFHADVELLVDYHFLASEFLAVLISTSWGCDMRDNEFIDLSFLWGCIFPRLLDALNRDRDLAWLQTRTGVVKEFLDQEPEFTYTWVGEWGQTFFHVATLFEKRDESWDMLKALTATMQTDDDGRTVLHYAAAAGNEAACRAMGLGDIGVRDRDNRLPVYYAARNGHHAVTRFLTEYM
ncbi:hypothetical protein B0T26DRAFT_732349 [Lasiosphaeria miniovina]|uniref:Uncharacterized protein n=1 Tax=Lasiosphaeria miniovina TaxID=1954250 RepID=A0AA39ZU49_9PEZI|nr:uncharacterized protein B0T26DRAFT_732349 [Lasiosphaeria miniovina]KAK0703708.1 hypothetical protein B0T26DRAFT_732349 [Lasiosphaeria miniovina]